MSEFEGPQAQVGRLDPSFSFCCRLFVSPNFRPIRALRFFLLPISGSPYRSSREPTTLLLCTLQSGRVHVHSLSCSNIRLYILLPLLALVHFGLPE
ncbi:hypothetical protein GYMLUDRAFT_615116 [Collybiopsis luxurians FD-317 M1]|uniref:Uncharacterized protein n=1 Tax=Collybiopsis luxurians FD-317 M1 TaxID=944289 RepID=A0A0D0CVY7_9AGAR|nr:hypothetical protein GYMLUDRAFT_615116 [Collybiopsis luxurians FD-317 M1]